MSKTLLEVENLSVTYGIGPKAVKAVSGVSFQLAKGETLGLVGESGCGKSTLAFALTRLLRGRASTKGSVKLNGTDLLNADPATLARMRWTEVAMVFQAAMNAMNPVVSVRRQIVEPMLLHGTQADRAAAEREAERLFEMVGLSAARLDAYPHELSGGMRQRAVLAMSLACRPKLLIADEPTTALDVVIQDQIFLKLNDIRREFDLSMILVSHDIGLIAENCDRVAVMYGGRIVEIGPTREVLGSARHPYTAALARATPTLSADRALVTLPGSAPDLSRKVTGCIFAHRCPVRSDLCTSVDPEAVTVAPEHLSRCHFAKDLQPSDVYDRLSGYQQPEPAAPGQTRIEIQDLVKNFALKRRPMDLLTGTRRELTAVNKVSFAVGKGEVIGIVGESGSGKTTLGMIIAGLERPSSGTIKLDGKDISTLNAAGRRALRREVQVVFQDPYDSLNPRQSIGDILSEPLRIHGLGASEAERRKLTVEMLNKVGLRPAETFIARVPAELSGGQRQRVAIARAMIVKPRILIADEPLSMLDASVKAGVMSLLADFKREGVTIIVVTHDLSITRYLCDRIAVFYLGELVELGPAARLIERPLHPYTDLLINSVPDELSDRKRIRLTEAEPPSAHKRPKGCAFNPRCGYATDRCRTTAPPILMEEGGLRQSACWQVETLKIGATR